MKQSDRNIFGLTYTQIHSFTVDSVKGVSWLRRELIRIRLRGTTLSLVSFWIRFGRHLGAVQD